MPTATTPGDVHAPSVIGGSRGRRRRKNPEGMRWRSAKSEELDADRELEAIDTKRSKTPFAYQGNILGILREDQVPRFFGALTDSEALPARKVKLADLTAMQNRVDTAKVKAMAKDGVSSAKLPVVVQLAGKPWIADGHHRLAAEWLKGEETAEVRFKNLDPETNVLKDYDPNQPRDADGKWTDTWSEDEFADLLLNDIKNEDENGGYEYYGLRFDDEVEINEGDDLAPSRVWVDGDPTDDVLDGTSAVRLKPNKDSIASAIRTAGVGKTSGYYGRVISLIGGNRMSIGEDAGEIIIRNAKAIKVYHRRDTMGLVLKRIVGDLTFETFTRVTKVDGSLGLVFGFAIVCKIDGEPYYDVQDDHIPEESMLKAASDFMQHRRAAKDMHAGDQIGDVVFAFPLTEDIAKALAITTKKTGLLIAMKPNAEVLAKYVSGEYTGFSLGGSRIVDEDG